MQFRAGLLIQVMCKLHGTFRTIKGHKGSLSIFAVAANGLAQLFRCAGNIQYIVYDLKNKTQTISILFQRSALCFIRFGRSRTI